MANELKTIRLPGIGTYTFDAESGVSTFDELTDTNFTNLSDGQIPVYNSTSEKWENKSKPSVQVVGETMTFNFS